MKELIDKINWGMIILLCLTLGLAPFNPPHIWEKITMLLKGTLKRLLDWFDLVLHSIPWVLLVIKGFFSIK